MQAAVYGVLVYAMIGFEWTAAKFFWYLFFMFFTLLYFTFYGMMSVAITPNHHVASIVAAAFYALWNLFSGYIVPKPVCFQNIAFSKITKFFMILLFLWLSCIWFVVLKFSLCLAINTEDPSMVEMVLLHMPSGMDPVWIGGFSIRRHKRGTRRWQLPRPNSRTVHHRLL